MVMLGSLPCNTRRTEWRILLALVVTLLHEITSQRTRLENLFTTNLGMNIANVGLINSTHALVLSDMKLYLSQVGVKVPTPSMMVHQTLDDQTYLLDIPPTNSNTSMYVVDSMGTIFTFGKENDALLLESSKYRLKHPKLQVLLIRGIYEIPNTQYYFCLVHYIPEFALVDKSKPSTEWKKSSGPIRSAAMNERLLVLVPFDGGFIDIYKLEGLPSNSLTTSNMLVNPGTAIGNLAEFTYLPQTDYFVAALQGHFVTADILLFDANPASLIALQSLGSWSNLAYEMRHVKQTSSIILVSNYSMLVLNVLNPSARTEFAGLPGSLLWNYLPAYNGIFGIITPSSYSGFIFKGTTCFEGCASCEEGANPNSCFSCLQGYILQDQKCILRQECPQGSALNIDTGVCEKIGTPGSYLIGTQLQRTGLIEGCVEYFPLLPTRCKDCGPQRFANVLRTSCLSTAQSCPSKFFQDTSISTRFCNNCHKSCDECSNTVNSGSCTRCKDGFKMNTNGRCVTDCVEGYYTDFTELKGNLNCRKCVTGCLECNNNHDSSCTKCVSGYFLVNGECRIRCPRSFVPDRNTGSCLFCAEENCSPCDPSEVLADGLCYSVCPNNTGTFNGRTCYPCHDIKCRLLRLSGGVVINAITGSPVDPDKLEEYDETLPRGWIWFFAALGFSLILFIIFVIGYSLYQKAGKKVKADQRATDASVEIGRTTHFAWTQPDYWKMHQEEMLYMRNTLVPRYRKPKQDFKIQLYPVPQTVADEPIPAIPGNYYARQQYPAYLNYRIPVHY